VRILILIALVMGACEEDSSPVDAGCIPIGHCGACDCDEKTDLQECGLCPIGKPDAGVDTP
jgi:hypothetical protein